MMKKGTNYQELVSIQERIMKFEQIINQKDQELHFWKSNPHMVQDESVEYENKIKLL
jgi:succinate dehydrogenase flavin-adding protein (antitoxin of CptAB toxin-antitoxin module)